jgi:hypothetical protein
MLQIFEKLQDLPIGWHQVVLVREKYPCSPEQAAVLLRQEFIDSELASSLNSRLGLQCAQNPGQNLYRPTALLKKAAERSSAFESGCAEEGLRVECVHHHGHGSGGNLENDYAFRPATVDDHSEASWNLVRCAPTVRH